MISIAQLIRTYPFLKTVEPGQLASQEARLSVSTGCSVHLQHPFEIRLIIQINKQENIFADPTQTTMLVDLSRQTEY